MSTIQKGSCLCGAVKYEVSADPAFTMLCHCRDCQRANGSAYTAMIVVPKTGVKVTGEVKAFTKKADNGNDITRKFCPNCGSALFSEGDFNPELLVVKVGTLDDPSEFKPGLHLFSRSEMPWAHVEDGAPRMPDGR